MRRRGWKRAFPRKPSLRVLLLFGLCKCQVLKRERERERAPALATVVCSQHPTLPAGNCFAERKRDSALHPEEGLQKHGGRQKKKSFHTIFAVDFPALQGTRGRQVPGNSRQTRNRSQCVAEHLQAMAKITSAFLSKKEGKRLSGEANSGKVLACHFSPCLSHIFLYPLLLYFLIFQSRADRSTSTTPNFLGIMLYSLRFTPSRPEYLS